MQEFLYFLLRSCHSFASACVGPGPRMAVPPSCHSTGHHDSVKPAGSQKESSRLKCALALDIWAEEGHLSLKHKHLGSGQSPGWRGSGSQLSTAGQQEAGTLVTSLMAKAGQRVRHEAVAENLRGGCFVTALRPVGRAIPSSSGNLRHHKNIPPERTPSRDSVRDSTQDQIPN